MPDLDYLRNRNKYKSQITRGSLSFRSKRLDAVVAAIDAFILQPSSATLDKVESTLAAWERTDPKEFKDRGLPLKQTMSGEVQQARLLILTGLGQITIPVIEPFSHPVYEPNLWNQDPFQSSTNCYAYACNSRTGHFVGEKPQPGSYEATRLAYHPAFRRIGKAYEPDPLQFGEGVPERSAPAVRIAIMRDGQAQGIDKRLIPIIRQPGEGVANIPGHYLVALVVAPGHQVPRYRNEVYVRDYHWYRQDRDGTWSHKPGHSVATDRDGSGNRIYDPRTCNMRASFVDRGVLIHVYYDFVMFFYCPRGGVAVGMQR